MFWVNNFWCFSLTLRGFMDSAVVWLRNYSGGSHHCARNCWPELRTFIIFPGTKEMMKPEDQLGTETTTKSHRFIVLGTEAPGIFLALMWEPFVLTFDKENIPPWLLTILGEGSTKKGRGVGHIKGRKCAGWDCTADHMAHDLPCRKTRRGARKEGSAHTA